MQNYSNLIMAAALAIFVSTSALAAISNIREMQDGSQISVTGMVDKVEGGHQFVLRDKTGMIDVSITSDQIIALKKGDTVTVNGNLFKSPLKTNINANVVGVNKNVGRAIDEAREDGAFADAPLVNIADLPKEGAVKVIGTITEVKNAQKFTLRDASGYVTVDVESNQKFTPKVGTDVTVMGYMDSGIFGRDINASRVLPTSEATASLQ